MAIYTLGCLIGALGIAPIGNRIGRRWTLILAAAIASIGLILQASAYSLPQLILGRIFSGIGNGGVNAVIPVWQSECTKPKSRGKNVVVVGVFITIGIATSGWVNLCLSYHGDNEFSWRLPLALPLVFTSMLLTFAMTFPESPRWLISKDREQEARDSIVKLYGLEHARPEAVDAEISVIRNAQSAHDHNCQRGFFSFFHVEPSRLLYRFCLAFAINFWAQMTGANVISYYGTTIFRESLHLSAHKSALLNAGVLTWKIVAATFAFFTVDRFGRKPLFIIACGGMAVAMAGLAGTVWAIDHAYSFGVSVAAVFFLFFYMAFFPLGFVGANFLYGTEIAPQDLRIHLASVGTAAHWLFNFVIAEITPVAIVNIKWRYYIVYAVIAISAVPVVYFLFPETRGLALEQMDQLFTAPDHFWQIPALSRKLRSFGNESRDDELGCEEPAKEATTMEIENKTPQANYL